MTRILGAIFGLPAAVALLAATGSGRLGFFEILGAAALIISFAIVAAGWAVDQK